MMRDQKGDRLKVGDLVEFWFCADHGAFPAADGCECGPTHMLDTIERIDGSLYFVTVEGYRAHVSRYVDVCKVICRV